MAKKNLKKNSSTLSREYIYKKISNLLRDDIDNGVYEPGTRLPSMDALADHFDVNKITILKAMDVLKSEGVIYSIPAKGTFVTEVLKQDVINKKSISSSKKTLSIGILAPVLSKRIFGPYHQSIMSGIQHEVGKRKCNVTFIPIIDSFTDADIYRCALESEVDALIYLGYFNNPLLSRLIKDGPPSVVVDHNFNGCTTDITIVDNVNGGYLIAKHLLDLGHKNIAVITGEKNQRATIDRMIGIENAIKEIDSDEIDLVCIEGDFHRTSGFDGTQKILKEHPKCTAICCMNDEMAAGAIQAINTFTTLSIPEDISITGYDDIQLADSIYPQLTTVHIDMRHMGKIAVERLFDRIEEENPNPSTTFISAQVVIRDSTASPKL